MMWKGLALAVVALVLQACVTTDEQQYTFRAPPTAEGKQCATQCQLIQRHCRDACEARADRCEDRSSRQSKADPKDGKGRGDRTADGLFGSCSADACVSECASDYRQCYSTCGGRVIPYGGSFDNDTRTERPNRPVRPVTPAPTAPPPPKVDPNAPLSKTNPGNTNGGNNRGGDAGLCRPGAKVQVRWQGEWYPARVKGPLNANRRCPIHYIGYGAEDDEAVPLNRMRAR